MGFFPSKDESRHFRERNRTTPTPRQARRYLITAFLGALVPLGLFLLLLSPAFARWLWLSADGSISPAHDLLTGYLRWYWLLLGFSAATIALCAVLFILQLVRTIQVQRTFRRLWKTEAIPKLLEIECWDMVGPEEKAYHRGLVLEQYTYSSAASLALAVGVLLSLITGTLAFAMAANEDIFRLPFQARADLAQIESGQLEALEVWISPKTRPARLPGPYSNGQPALTTLCGVIGEDTCFAWVQIWVPDSLGFALDPDRLFDETKPLAWNQVHAQRYLVRFTSNLHLAVEVTPAE